MNVPLVDLRAQWLSIESEVKEAFQQVASSASFILGDAVIDFEAEFAEFSGVSHVIGVANGTDALELCIRALGIGPGDEVIVPVNSFVASPLAVIRAGARPVFVDVDDEYLLMNPSELESAMTSRTQAIMPVHLFGQAAPMKEIQALAGHAGVRVIEDAAQSQGAGFEGGGVGGLGDIAGTSFYPGKNLGAFGDAGAVLTNSSDLDLLVRALRNYGSTQKYQHPVVGFNSRLDSLQAAILSVKLRHLGAWNQYRRAAAARYDELLKDEVEVRCPGTAPGNEHVWHLYVVRVQNRDSVLAALNEAGVGAGVHYPGPLHLLGAMTSLGYERGDFPVAERAADEILSLPLYPEITADQQEFVVQQLIRATAS